MYGPVLPITDGCMIVPSYSTYSVPLSPTTGTHTVMKRRRSNPAPLICEENLRGLFGRPETRAVPKSAGYVADHVLLQVELANHASNYRSRENALNSPLLRLPPELRIKIFEYVLGGNVIHIEQLSNSNRQAFRKRNMHVGSGLYNELCQASETEEEVYARFHDTSQDNKAKTPFYKSKSSQDLGHNYYVEPWSTRHSECGREPNPRRIHLELDAWLARPRLSCAALLVCRQIYNEACCIPYAKNTFCFGSASCFEWFALSLGPDQTHAIRHLNLLVGVGTAPFSDAKAKSWVHALRLHSIVHCLGSLKSLELGVEAYINTSDPHLPRKPTFEQFYEVLLSHDGSPTSWMAQLSTLCRNRDCKVRVVVADDPFSAWGPDGKKQYCWDYKFTDSEWSLMRGLGCLTIVEKRKFADNIEKLLRADETKWEEVLESLSAGMEHPHSD